ncbi:MAG TPA: EAL domain-containing protein [Acidiferrobacterales bacterium]|nr:EAL domain-containing protein [Acidiferrobacterales bacterium]
MTYKSEDNVQSRPAVRHYDKRSINGAFNKFLGIEDADRRILKRFHNTLIEGSEEFAKVFYSYLLSCPATAEILKRHEERGGEIAGLVRTQLQHLWNFLTGNTDDKSAERLAHVGELHQRFGIEPVWVMGAYLLYWDHLHARMQSNAAISEADKHQLEDAVTKLLFRDMGLMLEGYWDAAMQTAETEHRLVEELQEQVTSLLANLPQILWSVDVVNNRPLYVSPSTRKICDLNIEMPIPCLGWTVPEDRETVKLAWQKALLGEQVEVESRVLAPGENVRWFRRVFQPFRDATGRVVRIDGLMEDATDAKLTIERLHRLATTDSLTGLHNRALFLDRLSQAIASARRNSDRPHVVLMVMDLNHFKEINDTLGHPAGDAILRLVAERLNTVLRDTDTLARLGGDEFAILLPDIKDGRSTAEKVAQNILACFSRPFLHAGQELYLGAGIGIVVFPEHGEEMDTLMSRADVAMYGAKHRDIAHVFYDAASDPHTPERLQLSGELRRALENQEFVLHYQPQIDLKRQCVTGVEALIRWQHPQRGLLEPDEFIPVAERHGFINPITDWVVAESLKQCREWRRGGRLLRVAVNMPGRSFQQPDLVDKIQSLVRAAGNLSQCLEIEITENVLMADIEHGVQVLQKLNDAGFTITIDDYGTGYSSLAYLKKLPLNTMKIDKSFVLEMAYDENDAVIVRSTIDLAHNLGYQVVAEGVEDQETWDLLEMLGCDSIQGYHAGRPMGVAHINDWFKECPWKIGQDCAEA